MSRMSLCANVSQADVCARVRYQQCALCGHGIAGKSQPKDGQSNLGARYEQLAGTKSGLRSAGAAYVAAPIAAQERSSKDPCLSELMQGEPMIVISSELAPMLLRSDVG